MLAKKKFWILFVLGVWSVCYPADGRAQLIEPTRDLDGVVEKRGWLRALSEPPGMDVRVDGLLVGETPIFSVGLSSGAHVLRIQEAELDICLKAGKTTTVSWFKGHFIEIPEKVPPPSAMPQSPQAPPTKPAAGAGPDQRPKAANDPFYWPFNPRGPIY